VMAITNLMHDIVINILDEVLKKENNKNISSNDREDITAYVLNRVPPKYVTSERGLLYGILDARYQVQQQVDTLLLIYEAINKIVTRRNPADDHKDRLHLEKTSFLPHVVGQVLQESSLSIIAGVEVTLMHGNAMAAMVDTDWDNPYTTNAATKGHFHFWPKYIKCHMDKKSSVPFTISFRHPQFVETTIDLSLEVIKKSDFGRSQFIPTVLMKTREGN
jgi:competence protein ComFB